MIPIQGAIIHNHKKTVTTKHVHSDEFLHVWTICNASTGISASTVQMQIQVQSTQVVQVQVHTGASASTAIPIT